MLNEVDKNRFVLYEVVFGKLLMADGKWYFIKEPYLLKLIINIR
ncbi:MAG: hypothetical protein H6Q74_2839 [Firmicutes bacterium]|nr:hypothetical protein [Bacillota bacterium]